jgi:hypothetical protein
MRTTSRSEDEKGDGKVKCPKCDSPLNITGDPFEGGVILECEEDRCGFFKSVPPRLLQLLRTLLDILPQELLQEEAVGEPQW